MPNFVTSAMGEPHVTSANTAHYNAGTLGPGSYLLPVRSEMAATMTNSNTLRILSGDAVCCGRQWEISGDYEEVNIDNGTPGMKRIDVVACRIVTAPQEGISLVVLKGDETTGEPVMPEWADGDLNDGDTVCEQPICSVRIEGINPQEPVSMLDKSATIQGLATKLKEVQETLSQKVSTDSPFGAPSEIVKIYQAGWFLHVITGSGMHLGCRVEEVK